MWTGSTTSPLNMIWGKKVDVNDDLAREFAFYTQALDGTREIAVYEAQRNLARIRSQARGATASGRALALASRPPEKQLKVYHIDTNVLKTSNLINGSPRSEEQMIPHRTPPAHKEYGNFA